MLRIGLTGGIASGKSTVARAFVALGVPVVDADALYHALVAPVAGAPSPLVTRLAESAGGRFAGVVGPDGALDRSALGRIVFADATARLDLEAVTHPAVAEAAEAALQALMKAGHPWALYDVPLLYERALEAKFAGVVVVWVPREVQLARLAARDGIVGEAAEARLAAQLPLDAKRARAQWVVDNAGTREQALRQVRAVYDEVSALASR